MGLIGMIFFIIVSFVILFALGQRMPEEVLALTGDAETHINMLRAETGIGLLSAMNAALLSWGMWKGR